MDKSFKQVRTENDTFLETVRTDVVDKVVYELKNTCQNSVDLQNEQLKIQKIFFYDKIIRIQ